MGGEEPKAAESRQTENADTDDCTTTGAEVERAATGDRRTSGTHAERYPDHLMDFAPKYDDEIPESWQRFLDLREELLLNYGYNTARAYWGDLQDWFEWAVERGKDVLTLSEKEQRHYYALLRRRGYSDGTVRRRATTYRLLKRLTRHEPEQK